LPSREQAGATLASGAHRTLLSCSPSLPVRFARRFLCGAGHRGRTFPARGVRWRGTQHPWRCSSDWYGSSAARWYLRWRRFFLAAGRLEGGELIDGAWPAAPSRPRSGPFGPHLGLGGLPQHDDDASWRGRGWLAGMGSGGSGGRPDAACQRGLCGPVFGGWARRGSVCLCWHARLATAKAVEVVPSRTATVLLPPTLLCPSLLLGLAR
jgi:hypothetical protein